MIGMDDLQHIAIPLELARHPALLAHGQLLFRGIRCTPEECQRTNVPDRILRQHSVWPALIAAGAMLCRCERDDDLLAFARLVQISDGAARHKPFRHVVS